MRKTLIIILVVLLVVCLSIYWFFILYPKPFGYKILPPRSFGECQKAGGIFFIGKDTNIGICDYGDKTFQVNLNTFNNTY